MSARLPLRSHPLRYALQSCPQGHSAPFQHETEPKVSKSPAEVLRGLPKQDRRIQLFRNSSDLRRIRNHSLREQDRECPDCTASNEHSHEGRRSCIWPETSRWVWDESMVSLGTSPGVCLLRLDFFGRARLARTAPRI